MQNLKIGSEIVDKWNALPKNYKPTDLENIPEQYQAPTAKNRKMTLRTEALTFASKMLDKALTENIDIKCVSAFRSYEYQKIIYNNAIIKNGKKQNAVAKPGHSEHQLGNTIDLSSHEINYELNTLFAQTKAYEWLINNAHSFGFHFSYTKENHKSKGYDWEPWHLRYLGQKNTKPT